MPDPAITQRYCRVANLKVQRDYYKAMEVVLQRTQAQKEDEGRRGEHESPMEMLNNLLTARKKGNELS